MTPKQRDAAEVAAAISGVGPLARRLSQVHARLWHEQVDRDLTGPQFTVLSLLHTHGDMDQGTLGALAHLDKSTAAPLLDRLRRRGLVELTKDPADLRRKMIRITGGGREAAVRLAPAILAVNEQILAAFSPEEREQFLTLLRRAVEGVPGEDGPGEGHR
ncbi:MarR family transcriptional regulator [Streptomyces sp. NRRL F-4489]|uniref:MarR family winged helix-turn-helix transcriptional regulator n=1 Tax=Streptomyces sp. NRRL F-4489 TaxID=1609095 RepID=UPI0007494C03|nr:MarR family winged helix-turn-helix transcriptional regulator [Streptomyces sp. NRRL F-4489]KUL38847.1 MarR family transcriptional regulator [Streptomyces sp. NRRL F-4489]